jgi:hypothetical protein
MRKPNLRNKYICLLALPAMCAYAASGGPSPAMSAGSTQPTPSLSTSRAAATTQEEFGNAAGGQKLLQDIWTHRAQIRSGRFELTRRTSRWGKDSKDPPAILESHFSVVVKAERKRVIRQGEGFIARDEAAFMQESPTADKLKTGALQKRKEYFAYADDPVWGPVMYNQANQGVWFNMRPRDQDLAAGKVQLFDPRFLGVPETFQTSTMVAKGISAVGPAVEVIKNRRYDRVTLVMDKAPWHMDVWVDRELRQPTRIKATLGGRETVWDMEYKKANQSDLWFPTRTVVRDFAEGAVVTEVETVVKAAELNVPIDPSELSLGSLGMKRGTVFQDRSRMTVVFRWNGESARPIQQVEHEGEAETQPVK